MSIKKNPTLGRCCLPYLSSENDTLAITTKILQLTTNSIYIGKTVREAGLQEFCGMQLCGIQRDSDFHAFPPRSFNTLARGDCLTYICTNTDSLNSLENHLDLQLKSPASNDYTLPTLVAGIVPSYLSVLKNKNCREVGLKANYGLVLVTVIRNGKIVFEGIKNQTLLAGDVIICYGSSDTVKIRDKMSMIANKVHPICNSHIPQNTDPSYKYDIMIIISFGCILVAGIYPQVSTSSVSLSILYISYLSGSISILEIRNSLYKNRNVILGTSASLLLSNTFLESGLGTIISNSIQPLWNRNLFTLCFCIHMVTSILSLVLSNAAVVSILIPVLKESLSGEQLHLLLPISLTLIHGASCCFASPTGYHTNLMIHSVGGYKCRDFILLGLPLNILCSLFVSMMVYILYG